METLPIRIQILSIAGALVFMFVIARLIIKGRLREEYAILWIICTIILIVFSIWRRGLEQIALLLGVYYPPSLIFLAAIFAITLFLVHLSIVNSRMQESIKDLTHELAFLRKEVEKLRQHETVSAAEMETPAAEK
ncbi:DUF2304 domain-containing protein [Larkinella rosea]|uniref:DUF2304 domain-containing protein n=1 Tax=Larkinella rosea TaxID=2025312 RepID=A0A3P1BCU8_9BACT|nr:DUF2304 domain-containing protein [Larkinella rosea]RRA98715.1 DUF2304 domain-containing protein [Larkinella rosea]